MSQEKEPTVRRKLGPDPDTAKELLETAWPHCGAIQDIIDRLNEAGTNTEPRLLANLQGQASLIAKIEEQERWVEPTKHAALEEEIAALGISNRPMSGVRG
jgi:hypothetical protein